MTRSNVGRKFSTGLGVSAFIFLLLGLLTAGLGIKLLSLGGSPYYLIAGIGIALTGWLMFTGRRAALWLYALVLFGSTLWAYLEVKLDWWQLLPRLDVWFILGLWLLLPFVRKRLGVPGGKGGTAPLVIALAITAVLGIVSLFNDPYSIEGQLQRTTATGAPAPTTIGGDWPSWGGSAYGDRYSPLTQITPRNAGQLKEAWRIHTGDRIDIDDAVGASDQDTPLKIGDTLYVCTPHSRLIALDPTTGQTRWEFDPKIHSPTGSFKKWQLMICRGVSYHDDGAYAAGVSDCPRRLFLPTADARLIAINADDGKPCEDFGDKGTVNLLTENLGGKINPGDYYSTSPPAVTRNLVIVGSHVSDNHFTDEPSGVVRAFDVHDGHLVWNWDAGNPDETAPLPEGRQYVHSSPNMWSVISVDERLGLIYLPLGNQTPDQWGVQRAPGSEKYGAGVVALHLDSGKLAWNYQFTHHDLWDMDVGGQPTLVDIKTADGVKPALLASTKQGSIYVLNRQTGAPIVPIHEVPRPTSTRIAGEHVAPTQPLSELNFSPKPLSEASMWGTTPFDMLFCRIKFKSLRYEGPFTPPSEQGSIVYPGDFGVFDWGGISVDPVRQIALLNPNEIAFVDRLVPRQQATPAIDAGDPGIEPNPNIGGPYAASLLPLLAPWGVPCQAPPWGYVAAVDLTTHQVIWQHKNGTVRDSAPLPIPLPLGVPALGGMVSTAGGVTFLGGTLDYYLRAYDVGNGKQLWQGRLPAGGQANPMTYMGKDGRQYVVIVAGGHGSMKTKLGDYVIAYALPRK